MGEWIKPKELPMRYGGISTCFRKEAGSSGQDVWGIFRVHQFEKVEQFIYCDPKKSWDELDKLIEALAQLPDKRRHIVIMSNGSFGGIYQKLPTRLRSG